MAKLENIGLGAPKGVSAKNKKTIMRFENGSVLVSYETIVAAFVDGQLYLAPEHDCSTTTNRHVKEFCGLTKEERNKGLADGSIKSLEC